MDESKLRPGFPGDRSQAAAEKLRALRERANQALDDHRRRLGEIETQLSDRVRHLAEEFGAPLVGAAPPSAGGDQQAEIESLRRQVEEGRVKHERFVEQLIAARKQLDAIQSQPCPACQQAAEQLATAEEEARRLREQVDVASRLQQEDRARHEKFVEQLAAARQAITVLQQSAGESTAELRRELESAGAARAAAEAEQSKAEQRLAASSRDIDVLHVECEALGVRVATLERELNAAQAKNAELQEQAATLADQSGAASTDAAQLRSQLHIRSAELRDAVAAAASLEERLAAVTAEKGTVDASLADLQAATAEELAGLVGQLAAAEAEGEQLRRQLQASESDKLTATLAISQAEGAVSGLQQGLAAAERRIAETERQLVESEQRLADAQQRLAEAEQQAAAGADAPALRRQLEQAQAAAQERSQLTGDLKEMLDEASRELELLRSSMVSKADLDAARRDVESRQATIAQLEQEVAALRGEVGQAQADSTAVRASMRPASELAELQQKFELALADVQKLKRENSALREELAERPAASDQETPELIAVRSERDALAARIAELEQSAAVAATNVDAEQERDDLQRRFEMAVDDVRQLKQENAQLRDKLAATAPGLAAAETAGGSDWAAQRAKLMAMLEEEDEQGDVSPERVAERVTVTKTIAATDRVIANKDQEIAELRTELEAHSRNDSVDNAAAQLREEAFDADEVVARERQRLAALNAEWEDKLRAAELEFSVERAKLAREQAALRERMFELQSGAPAAGAHDGDPSKPRRRWMSALGLHDEADDDKKKKK
jgi:chromosome segregation ATPase